MTQTQAVSYAGRLQTEVDREREERNFFQLERDQVAKCWSIDKHKIEQLQAQIRIMAKENEEREEKHKLEMKVYKQKIKHLLYDHQQNIAERVVEGTMRLKVAEDDHRSQEHNTWKEKRELKVSLKDQELAHERARRSLQMAHAEEITKLREDYLTQTKSQEEKAVVREKRIRTETELRKKTEIHEIEERKNTHIKTLMKQHNENISQMKNYYNDLVLNHLATIDAQKEEILEVKRKEDRMMRKRDDVVAENKTLVKSLSATTKEVEELRVKLQYYEKDQSLLKMIKRKFNETEKKLEELKFEHEVLEQRFAKVQEERDELHKDFGSAVREVKHKSSFKSFFLTKKLNALNDELEKKETQLSEILAHCNLDPTSVEIVSRKLEHVLDAKNEEIKDVRFELARVCKAHNDVLRTCEAKLQQFGIPKEELGFKPLESIVGGQQLGQGPAGLVSDPNV